MGTLTWQRPFNKAPPSSRKHYKTNTLHLFALNKWQNHKNRAIEGFESRMRPLVLFATLLVRTLPAEQCLVHQGTVQGCSWRRARRAGMTAQHCGDYRKVSWRSRWGYWEKSHLSDCISIGQRLLEWLEEPEAWWHLDGVASAALTQTDRGLSAARVGRGTPAGNAIGDKKATQKEREFRNDKHFTVRADLPLPTHPDEIIPFPNCNQSSEKHSGAGAHSAINSPGPGVLLFKYYNHLNVFPASLFLPH